MLSPKKSNLYSNSRQHEPLHRATTPRRSQLAQDSQPAPIDVPSDGEVISSTPVADIIHAYVIHTTRDSNNTQTNIHVHDAFVVLPRNTSSRRYPPTPPRWSVSDLLVIWLPFFHPRNASATTPIGLDIQHLRYYSRNTSVLGAWNRIAARATGEGGQHGLVLLGWRDREKLVVTT